MERRPKVHIHFSLGGHGSETAVLVIPTLEDQVRYTFSNTGINIYHDENSGGTKPFVELTKNHLVTGIPHVDATQFALLKISKDPLIDDQKGLQRYISEYRREMSELANADPHDIRDHKMADNLFGYVELEMLDRLKEDFRFRYEGEYHSPKTIKALREVSKIASEYQSLCSSELLRGNVDQAMQFYDQSLILKANYLQGRNRPYIRSVQRHINEADWSGSELRMVIRVGSFHDAMVQEIASLDPINADYKPIITTAYDSGQPVRFLSHEIINNLQTDPNYYPTYSEKLRALTVDMLRALFPDEGAITPERVELLNRIMHATSDQDIERLISLVPRYSPDYLLRHFFKERFPALT